MDGSEAAVAGSAGGSANIGQLQQLFEQFSSTLVQLRTVTTEGQQKIETARARPQ